MRVLSLAAASDEGGPVERLLDSSDWTEPFAGTDRWVPQDSGRKVALARSISDIFFERRPVALWITSWGIWPSSEHMDLFDQYRAAHSERRPLHEAPIHLFESDTDRDALLSILSLVLFFGWDAEIFTWQRTSLSVTLSHDAWLCFRCVPGQNLESYFKTHIEPMLMPRPTSGVG